MSVITPTKIFLDTKDEITTAVERILKAKEKQLIVIIPERSILFTSPISIGILYRKAVLANKTIIIVTEDERGAKLAQRRQYIVVSKVSQISSELWEFAYDRLLKEKKKLDQKFHPREESFEVNENITEDEKEEAQQEEIEEEHKNAPAEVDFEEIEEVAKSEIKFNTTLPSKKDLEEVELSETEKDYLGEQSDISKESHQKELERKAAAFKRPTIKPKVVSVGGIQIVAGGDVAKIGTMEQENRKESENILNEDTKNMNTSTGSFAGMDFTKVQAPKKKGFNFFNTKKGKSNDEDFEKKKVIRRRILIGILGSILLLLIVSVFSISALAEVEVNISLARENIETSQQIVGSTTQTDLDIETLTVPTPNTEEASVSGRREGTPTGSGVKGEKAKGFITLYNYTDDEITFGKGAKLTSVSTSLVYVLDKSVTLEANDVNEEPGVDNTSIVEDVPVTAEKLGDEYNASGSSSNTTFTIEGYSISQIEGKRFSSFEGGTSEEFVTVSQENVDELAKQIQPDLEEELRAKITSTREDGFRVIPDTFTFGDVVITPNPKVGEEVTGDSFSLTVEITGKAKVVKEDDLLELAEFLVSNTSEDSILSDVSTNEEDLAIIDVTNEAETVRFTLTTAGTVAQALDENDVKELIRGKNLLEAREALANEERIDTYAVVYSPFYVPGFARSVPNNLDKITISINE